MVWIVESNLCATLTGSRFISGTGQDDFMRTFRLLALVLPLLLPTPPVEVAAAPQSGESGATIKLLAASCSGCHANAASDDTFPEINGRPAAEIQEAMLAFRADERKGTVMNRIAKGYSETEIGAIADYLAALDEDAED